ncbi:MAG: hypothetical protein ABSD59_12910 [Terracidiphilus sp.]|jgi:hypothetical protein
MTLEIALSVASLTLASALVAVMAYGRVFRSSPLFFAYVCFDLGAGAAALAIYHYSGLSIWYWLSFLFQTGGDFLLCLCVLTELGKNLLRSNKMSRPHFNLAVLLFAGAAVLIGVLARWTIAPGRSPLANICFVGMRADNELQFAAFLALAGWSSLRKLRWPERELRIATGLGFLAFVWFIIALLQFQWNNGPVYFWLYRAGQAAGMIILAYWLHYFWMVDQGSLAREDAEPDSRRGRDDSEPTRCLGDVRAVGGVAREVGAMEPFGPARGPAVHRAGAL